MKRNTEIITASYMANNKLVFHPQTLQEAHDIQLKLFSMGGRWGNGDRPLPADEGECVKYSLNVHRGELRIQLEFDRLGALLCTLEDFDTQPVVKVPEYETLLDKFNTLSERFDRLAPVLTRQSDLIEKLYNELHQETSVQIARKTPNNNGVG